MVWWGGGPLGLLVMRLNRGGWVEGRGWGVGLRAGAEGWNEIDGLWHLSPVIQLQSYALAAQPQPTWWEGKHVLKAAADKRGGGGRRVEAARAAADADGRGSSSRMHVSSDAAGRRCWRSLRVRCRETVLRLHCRRAALQLHCARRRWQGLRRGGAGRVGAGQLLRTENAGRGAWLICQLLLLLVLGFLRSHCCPVGGTPFFFERGLGWRLGTATTRRTRRVAHIDHAGCCGWQLDRYDAALGCCLMLLLGQERRSVAGITWRAALGALHRRDLRQLEERASRAVWVRNANACCWICPKQQVSLFGLRLERVCLALPPFPSPDRGRELATSSITVTHLQLKVLGWAITTVQETHLHTTLCALRAAASPITACSVWCVPVEANALAIQALAASWREPFSGESCAFFAVVLDAPLWVSRC